MNRRERKQIEANLGLKKFYKKQTRSQRFERWRENQDNGKRMQEETKERVRVMQNMTDEEKDSAAIAILAQKIATKKEIPLIDAMEEAKLKYERNKV